MTLSRPKEGGPVVKRMPSRRGVVSIRKRRGRRRRRRRRRRRGRRRRSRWQKLPNWLDWHHCLTATLAFCHSTPLPHYCFMLLHCPVELIRQSM